VLLSMTGYGEALHESEKLRISVELRALNNRYLKVSVRAAEPYNLLEAEFEKVIRKKVRRGTVQVNLRVDRQFSPHDFRVNVPALKSYVDQVRRAAEEMGLRDKSDTLLAQVLALPGVVPEPGTASVSVDDEWPILERVLDQAVDKLQAMRLEEGKAMGLEFQQLRNHISSQLEQIRAKAPQVTESYRDRIFERVKSLLAEHDVKIDRTDLIKEVSIFAERSDIAEEVVRLASHLDQFQEIMKEPESPGRKLEFLTQEMFREANTIGSKAGDVEISRRAVEIKGTLEKIRELVQNVE
jgi:uncharacterized protein (TIGR00255 family)